MRATICRSERLGKHKASSDACVWRMLWEAVDRYGLESEQPQRVAMVTGREAPDSWYAEVTEFCERWLLCVMNSISCLARSHRLGGVVEAFPDLSASELGVELQRRATFFLSFLVFRPRV